MVGKIGNDVFIFSPFFHKNRICSDDVHYVQSMTQKQGISPL
jgi:hypothetical protein